MIFLGILVFISILFWILTQKKKIFSMKVLFSVPLALVASVREELNTNVSE